MMNFITEMEKRGESIKHKVVRLYGDDKHKLQAVNQFHRKQKKGFIDVWWLFDDGGKFRFCTFSLRCYAKSKNG